MHSRAIHPYAQVRRKLGRVLCSQCVLIVLAALAAFFWAAGHSFCVLLGGGAFLVPTLLYIYYFCGANGRISSKRVVYRFYVGGLLRFVMCAAFLAALMVWRQSDVLSLLCGFVAGQVGSWLAPFVS